MPFDVSKKPVESMTDDEVVAEAEQLRTAITECQGEIGTRKAEARRDNAMKSDDYLVWIAGARKYLMLLQARLSRLRPRERDINVQRHRTKK